MSILAKRERRVVRTSAGKHMQSISTEEENSRTEIASDGLGFFDVKKREVTGVSLCNSLS